MKLKADKTHRLDEFSSIDKRVAVLSCFLGNPITSRLDPKIDLATIYQLLVILIPVTFVAHGFAPKVWSPSSLNPWFFIYQEILMKIDKAVGEAPAAPNPLGP